jgi:putative DNA primase/helicase
LVDEADTFLGENEELRGVLNSGHTRETAFVTRVVGDDLEPRNFSTWGAKAIAAIGHLPGTILDRAIVLEMRRRTQNESIEKLRYARRDLFTHLASKCVRWVEDNAVRLAVARPGIPSSLNDRAGDNWEPLLAIAELAGGNWPKRARDAALALSGGEEEPSLGVELLADVRLIFQTQDDDRLSGADLIAALVGLDDRPWATRNKGKPLTQHQLSRRLGEFGIVSKSVRLNDGKTPKGYMLEQFEEAFTRYLPPPKSQQRHERALARDSGNFDVATDPSVLRVEKTPNSAPDVVCGSVASSIPPFGVEGGVSSRKSVPSDDDVAGGEVF